MRVVRQPRVAVIAFPFLYTSAIAHVLRAQGGYAVEAPDILAADWEPNEMLDVVIASFPVPRAWARVVITLPEDFADGVAVSVGDLNMVVDVDEQSPLQGLLSLVDLVAADPSVNVSDALLGVGGRRTEPSH